MPTSPAQLPDSSQICPHCGAPLVVEPGYVTWCDRCNWNVLPERLSHGRVEALYDSLGERLGQKLFDEIKQKRSLKPQWTMAWVGAWLLALSVHSLTLALLFLSAFFILNNRGSCLSLFGGMMCLGLAWILRPRPTELPREVEITPRTKAPAIYHQIDEITTALDAPRLDGIVIDADFNAAYLTVGWRRKRILMLGLPLLFILAPQERVAIVAHELAHSVNGDPARGLVVGSALNTLMHWYTLLIPDPTLNRRYGLPGTFTNGVLLVLSLLPWTAAFILIHLLYRDSQRSEYLADRLAAQISGTAAALSALEKLHLRDTFALSVRRSTLNSDVTDFFAEFRQRVAHLPLRELERIRRAERVHGSRLNMTHPPTVYRVDALQAYQVTIPRLTCEADHSQVIEQELTTFKTLVERELKRLYEASLYG